MVKKNYDVQAPVTFNDLSGALQTLVVIGWIGVAFFAIAFMTGFIMGIMGV